MLAKVRGSVRASDEEISANLSRLAQVRPDVFAGEGAALGDALSEHMGAQGRLPIGAARAEAPREAASADAPPLPPAVPPAKRQRTLPLLPEAEFLADRGAQAQVLRVQAAPECGGQALQLPLDSLLLSVGVLKAMLGGLVGLPAPRLQLRVAGEEGAPLPDEQTLAALNVDQDIELELSRSA
ncbi:hypothetical protein H632_c2329p1 [Helicosporidium sp. ATCC 50920]|nr:hypothetical protein H632_c2329p1 [Helicosporidium sp. ATCC 50920]|eukprot:KDD73299.1 hypothetical protein H632_c2329p1 [Helicosporidium sp. ATCC 50920]